MVDLKQIGNEFSKLITPELNLILNTLLKNKKDAYIIGGAVRDFITDQRVKDFDVATNATPDQIIKWLTEVNIKTKPIGGKWGTVLAIVGKQAFDISTYRKETFHTFGQPPEVTLVDSLDEDLRRRDFKINTLIFDPKCNQIIDNYQGIKDIEEGTISIIGDSKIRLLEDGLRIIRLARFMSKFNLVPTNDIIAAVSSIGESAKYRSKRVLQIEIFKLLQLPDPGVGFTFLVAMNIFPSIFPAFPFSSTYRSKNTIKLLERFSLLPITNEITRLFGLLLIISDQEILVNNDFKRVENSLLLSNRQGLSLNRLYTSWINFPVGNDPVTIKHWVRATGINTSEDLANIYYLNLKRDMPDSKISNEGSLLVLINKAVDRLRKGKN